MNTMLIAFHVQDPAISARKLDLGRNGNGNKKAVIPKKHEKSSGKSATTQVGKSTFEFPAQKRGMPEVPIFRPPTEPARGKRAAAAPAPVNLNHARAKRAASFVSFETSAKANTNVVKGMKV